MYIGIHAALFFLLQTGIQVLSVDDVKDLSDKAILVCVHLFCTRLILCACVYMCVCAAMANRCLFAVLTLPSFPALLFPVLSWLTAVLLRGCSAL